MKKGGEGEAVFVYGSPAGQLSDKRMAGDTISYRIPIRKEMLSHPCGTVKVLTVDTVLYV